MRSAFVIIETYLFNLQIVGLFSANFLLAFTFRANVILWTTDGSILRKYILENNYDKIKLPLKNISYM